METVFIRNLQAKTKNRKTGRGIPESLKSGTEHLSGYDLDDVRVHDDSYVPAQMQALAYTQGADVHAASGQEGHQPYEHWHAAQRKQGRVQPAVQFFNRGGFSFRALNRPQPAGADGLGHPSAVTLPMGYLQRDHIIPYSRIRDFADIVFHQPDCKINSAGNYWLENAVSNFQERSSLRRESLFYKNNDAVRSFDSENLSELKSQIESGSLSGGDKGFSDQEYFEVLHKAISWMPANIFMAPHPKEGDQADELDVTAAGVSKLKKHYAKFVKTDQLMQKVQTNHSSKKPYQKEAKEALKELAFIAALRNQPWPYDENDWTNNGRIWSVNRR